ACGPEIHRPRAALATLQHVEADVRRDAVEPGTQSSATLELVEVPPGAYHRLLDGVLRFERGSEHPVAVGGQLDPVLFELGCGGGFELAHRRESYARRCQGQSLGPVSSGPVRCQARDRAGTGTFQGLSLERVCSSPAGERRLELGAEPGLTPDPETSLDGLVLFAVLLRAPHEHGQDDYDGHQ